VSFGSFAATPNRKERKENQWCQMNLTRRNKVRVLRGSNAFTLIDALFATAMAGVMFTSLYAGLAFGFKVVKMARENTRATQIMLEKMETIRLYTWSQITNDGFIPTAPVAVPYYAVGSSNSSIMYTAQTSIAACDLGTTYASDMRKITIRVDWSPLGSSNRTRTMSTYVSNRGLQGYVY
jgi:hypothetical protein